MQQHRFHAERVGDQAGVLAAGPAEAVEQIFGDVVAALDRYLLDGVGHVLDRHGDEAVGHLLRCLVSDLTGQLRELRCDDFAVQPLVLGRAEDRRKKLGLQLAEHDIGIGDGERAAASVAGRAGVGACRIRAGAEAPRLEMQDRPAARCDRVDAHHRRTDAHAGDFGVEGALVVAVIVGDVGRGAAHVEADHLAEAGEPGRLDHADHAAGRAGQDGVLALEAVGRGEAARRHHEHQAGVGINTPLWPARWGCNNTQLLRHPADIPRQDRRQVGIDDGGVAAPDQLHQRRHLMAHRDLRKAGIAAKACDGFFMLRIFPRMHEDDGDGIDAVVARCVQRAPHGVEIRAPARRFRRHARARRSRRRARKAAREG